MKAQVLLELDEIFPAIQEAEMAVSLNPRCPNSFQTLGRAQVAFGEIEMAIINFSKALHAKPDSDEIRNEDLSWALDLRKEKNERESSDATPRSQENPP
ncbi:tetratricopeptide repeat protein 33-like isoform X2 [Dendronephthya gigantea]|nr:tetratricopeptide repeat protein 33-like isoform X2 [Dendronephthya gigantea]